MKNRLPIALPFILVGSVSLFSSCSLMQDLADRAQGNNRAFIAYWPPAEGSTRLKLAVKDNIDMKGVVTTAGSEYFAKNNPPAKKDAACLAIARQRNVEFVGKASLSEFAIAPSGINEYFGTPRNPMNGWRRFIPGGSSSGSAVAVATGMADVAFGTDTAGSVRVPSACCGIVGLKTTFGLVSIKGVHPIEPKHLDTVGPMGKDIEHAVKGMELLQGGFASLYATAKAAKPSGSSIRIGRLRLNGTAPEIDKAVDDALALAGFQVVELGDDFRAHWEKATADGNTLAASGAWISDKDYRLKPGISTRSRAAILVGRIEFDRSYKKAISRQDDWQRVLARVFRKVDIIALPTIQTAPLSIPPDLKIGIIEARVLGFQNTVAANFSGNPALAMPIPVEHSGVDVTSLQLIGPPRSEAWLLNAGRLVEAAVAD